MPQEIEAMVMPSLEEVSATMDSRGSQWVQQALAPNRGESGRGMKIHVHCRNFLEYPTIEMH